jgi:4-hydroxy-2-oxoheptanedioate aldolase
VRKNNLRELLRSGKPTLGTHLNMDNPVIVELVGHSGMFDYVELVAEYGTYDLKSLENFGRAVDLFPNFSAMIKVEQEPRTFITVRALGSGIQNLLFADIHSAAEAKACIAAVRAEAPGSGGIHGVGMRRDVGYVLEGGSSAWIKSLDEAVVCLMIEKKECIEDLESVLAVPGIDMVQFGPSDYSMSIGVEEQYQGKRHPATAEAEKYTIETAMKLGIRPRVELGSPDGAKPYLDMGVKDFCVGWDVVTLFEWFKNQGKAMRELLGVEINETPLGGPFRN